MAFKQDGDRITVSAEYLTADTDSILVPLGMAAGFAFELGPERGWRYIEFLNDLFKDSPNWDTYEIPADRSQPFTPKYNFVRLDIIDEPPPVH
jgi:hypothetical protein